MNVSDEEFEYLIHFMLVIFDQRDKRNEKRSIYLYAKNVDWRLIYISCKMCN